MSRIHFGILNMMHASMQSPNAPALRLNQRARTRMLPWALAALSASMFCSCLPASRVQAQDSSLFDSSLFNEAERMLDVNTVELGIQLKRGLRVFLPEQEQFIDRVLVEVGNRRLSRSMVNVIYIWSLRRNPKVPFPYFEFVMRELAKQRGVNL